MAEDLILVSNPVSNFFSKITYFNNFNNIDQERLKELEKELIKVRKYTKDMPGRIGYYTESAKIVSALDKDNYLRSLPYDEKIILFILTIDPDLKAYHISKKYDIPNNKVIAQEIDKNRKEELILEKKQKIKEMLSEIYAEVGINDLNFVNYEIIYHKRFIKNIKLNTFNKDLLKDLVKSFREIENFDSITPENIDEIKKIVENFKKNYKPFDNLFVYHQIINKSVSLGLDSEEKKAIFFILVLDEELELLKSYFNEYSESNIKKRALDKVGFYNTEIIKLEKLYHKAFTPSMNLDEWN